MDINFEYYKIFYHVAKYGNITKAAAALGSSQPNVTRILKLLESQLDCRLFLREARGVRLTEEGEKLFSHVDAAYRHLLCAEEEIGRRQTQASGVVTIGATETALHLFLLEAIRDFRAGHPQIRIRIHNHATRELLHLLASGKLDFAVVTAPFQTAAPLCREELLSFHEILVGGTQYLSLGQKQESLRTFLQYPWIGLGKGTVTHEFYREFFAGCGLAMELAMEVATSDLMIPLIQNNLGIGFVPKPLAQPLLDTHKLVQLHPACTPPPRRLELLHDKRRIKSAAADILYRYLKQAGPSTARPHTAAG